ncbi:MAG TPA: VOC family protein [Ktedonosporobacter sp.]|nr:VOC family protein [Ktedonosporobacter sp.]
MLKHYDNFFLPAADLARGREFYQGILNLPVKFDFSSYGLLAFRVGEEGPAIILSSRPNAKPSIMFEVDDVRVAYEELKEKGIVFLSEPYEINTGLAVEFEDPFGNRLAITDYSKKPELSDSLKDKDLPG